MSEPRPPRGPGGSPGARMVVLLDARMARRRRTGGTRYIRGLIRTLGEAHGADIDLRVAWGPPPLPRRNALTSLGNLALDLAWVHACLPALALRHRADLIHSPFNWAPLLSPCPRVVTVLDLSFERTPERYPGGFRRYASLFTRLSARRARRVVAISRATADDVHAYYGVPSDRIDVVHIGVDGAGGLPGQSVAADWDASGASPPGGGGVAGGAGVVVGPRDGDASGASAPGGGGVASGAGVVAGPGDGDASGVSPPGRAAREAGAGVDAGVGEADALEVSAAGGGAGAPGPGDAALAREPVILCVGEMEPRKRVPEVVEGATRYSARVAAAGGRPFGLLVVGTGGSDEPGVRALAEASGGAARVLGRVSDPELHRLYARAGLLVANSTDEGFGLPVAEAAVRGCPALVADTPALREAGGPDALVIAGDGPEAVAAALEAACADPAALAARGARARRYAARFSWAACAAGTVAAYRAALGGTP